MEKVDNNMAQEPQVEDASVINFDEPKEAEKAEPETVEIEIDRSQIAEVKPKKKKGLSDDTKEWIRDICAAIIIAAIVLQFVMPTIVREHSMENTLQENDYVFVSKKSYTWFGQPQRGDIIVFQSSLPLTGSTNKLLVKRIIGLEGDRIYILNGVTYVNDEPVEDTYTKDGYTLGDMDVVTVPEGCLFCMGDNRQNSADSRDSRIGFVKLEDVKGKVVFRLFPFGSFGKIE